MEAIHKAKQKYGNNKITFEVIDIRNLNEITEKYSKIIAIDSLFFFGFTAYSSINVAAMLPV